MRLPPWLIGLVLALVVAVAWWTVAGDSSGDNAGEDPDPVATPAAVPTPTSDPTEPAPAPTPSPTPSPTPVSPSPGSQDQGPDQEADQGADQQDRAELTGVDTRPWDGIDACEEDILPATMIGVVEDIWAEGPYDYPDRDGTRFGNYEGYLPDEDLGYYREFTVETPGLNHRGARRIVTGGWDDPDVWYYTEDHYESFCEFAP